MQRVSLILANISYTNVTKHVTITNFQQNVIPTRNRSRGLSNLIRVLNAFKLQHNQSTWEKITAGNDHVSEGDQPYTRTFQIHSVENCTFCPVRHCRREHVRTRCSPHEALKRLITIPRHVFSASLTCVTAGEIKSCNFINFFRSRGTRSSPPPTPPHLTSVDNLIGFCLESTELKIQVQYDFCRRWTTNYCFYNFKN